MDGIAKSPLRRTHWLGSLYAVLGVLLLVAGCGGGVNIAEVDARSKKFAIVAINDGSLQSDAEIVNGRALYQEQLLQAVIEVNSHSNGSQKLYYKFNWFDGDDFPLAEAHWQFLPLLGNERKVVTANAPQPKAVRCQFMLRRPSSDDHEN